MTKAYATAPTNNFDPYEAQEIADDPLGLEGLGPAAVGTMLLGGQYVAGAWGTFGGNFLQIFMMMRLVADTLT